MNGIHDFEDLPVSPRALSLLARGRRIYQPMKADRINQQVRLEPEGSPVAAGMPEAANWTVLPGTTAHQYEFRISVNLCLAANSAGTWAVLHQCGGGYGTYWIATAGPDGHSCVFESRQFPGHYLSGLVPLPARTATPIVANDIAGPWVLSSEGSAWIAGIKMR